MKMKEKVPRTGEAKDTLRINVTISGLCSIWAKEIKEAGLATSNHDLVNQAIKALYIQFTNERLKIARLRTLETAEENNDV